MSRINIGKVAPIPKGDWVQSQPYEKLNMVSKSGVLYIAKQDVPANTAITNTDYWMPANGQLSIGTVETVSASTGASATITDGSNGPELNLSIPRGVTGNESIDDTKGKGDTDYVWSADKNYEEINKLYNNKLDASKTSELSGSIVTFEAENDHAIKDLKVEINPVQDLHGYDAPWPAGGGKNLCPPTGFTHTGVTTDEGYVTTYQTRLFSPIIPVTAGSTYTAKIIGESSNNEPLTFNRWIGYDSSKTFVQRISLGTTTLQTVTGTIPSGISYIVLDIRTSALTTDISESDIQMIQLELGSSATSWTPYSNICSITGWDEAVVTRTGKNLFDKSILTTSSSWQIVPLSIPSGVYTMSTDKPTSDTSKLFLYFRLTGSSILSSANAVYLNHSVTLTIPDGNTAEVVFRRSEGTDEFSNYNYQLELGSSASEYESYQGTEVTVELGDTRYGGELDVTTGVLTVDRAIVDLGTLSWTITTMGTYPRFMSADLVGIIVPPATSNTVTTAICSNYKAVEFAYAYTATIDKVFAITDNQSNARGRVNVVDSSYSDTETFKTAMSGVQLCYPLATPFTVQLTPSQLSTLLGTNHIWADTGDSTVTLRLPTGDLAYQDTVDYETEVTNKPDLNEKATAITETASGSIASFSDGSASPVTALSVSIEPVQDLHGYDNPWPAGGGKNLLNMSWLSNQTVNGITFTNNDGQITISGTATATTNLNGPIFVLPAGTYLLSGSISNNQLYLYDNDNNVAILESVNGVSRSVTISENKNVYLRVRVGSGASVSGIVKPQLESGSSATSWTPYSNICPISGHTSAVVTRTGINIWDEEWETGAISLSTGQNTSSSSRIRSKNYIRVDPSGAYWFTGTNNNAEVLFYDKYKNYISYRNPDMPKVGGLLSQPNNCYFVRFVMYSSYGTSYNNDISINYPSTDTQYHAYQGTSVIIDLDGTRYGGTLDVLTGKLTVDSVFTTLDGNESTWYESSGLSYPFRIRIDNYNGTSDPVHTIICDKFTSRAWASTTEIQGITSNNSSTFLAFRYTVCNDLSAWKTWLGSNNVNVVYPLATPLTVQLSSSQLSTLLSENHIWADTGDTEVTYRADTKLYIEKLTQPTEDDMIANNNIEANKFFMLGNSLYYSTTAIAVGTSIIPGDNCTKLSLADALNNLNS